MIRILVLSVLFLVGVAAEQVVDRVVRYVNADIITAGDQWDQMRLQVERARREGRPLPEDEAAWLAFRDRVLDELTDELLKVQEAERMGVQIDERPLKRQLRQRARAMGWNLAVQSRMLEREVREQKIGALENYFAQSAADIGPQELAAAYQSRRGDFTRPARFHPYRLLLRATPQADRDRLFQVLLEVFKQAQVDPEPAIQAVVTAERRKDYIAKRADAPAQQALLLAVAADVLAAAPAEPRAATRQLLELARTAVEAQAALLDRAQIEQTLEALRQELVAIEDPAARVEAFIAAVKRIGMGPQAKLGGDVGWQAPGQLVAPYDAGAATLGAGESSPVLGDGDAVAVVLVAERQEARQRPLAEVSAELRKLLERERRLAMVERLASSLRARAHIQDLEPLAIEDVQAVAGVEENAEALQEQVDGAALLRVPRVEDLAEMEPEVAEDEAVDQALDSEPEVIDPGAEALGPQDDPLDGR
jgi:parvulin-like peptidyl-prolyl isomerase